MYSVFTVYLAQKVEFTRQLALDSEAVSSDALSTAGILGAYQ